MSGSQSAADGVTRIEAATPLTRLHYFDGKYLRADALTLEQDYHRELVRLSNLAGGWGVVHGLGLGQVGAALAVTPGLAITPTGRMVLLTQGLEVPVAALVEAAAQAPAEAGKAGFGDCGPAGAPPAAETAGQGIYEVTVGPAQALCGKEEVFGRLCEDACLTDTARPYWREGLVLRLRPVALSLPDSSAVALGQTHLRSRVASAYFAREPGLPAPLLSAQGLGSTIWCGPATLHQREEVPIGLLVREGSTVRVLDAWAARRERMEAQARGHWQGRMRMRPWNVFLAQILQFQCQLAGLFQNGSPVFEPQQDDDCAMLRRLLAESVAELEATRRAYAEGNAKILSLVGVEAMGSFAAPNSQIEALAKKLADAQSALPPATPNRMLLNGGFVELPPAGYLPVVPGQSPVNAQLERMFGEGVALSYCTAPLDHLGHLLEQAQHMDRISLTRGLDDPQAREAVEIIVPDGEILGTAEAAGAGVQWYSKADPLVIDDIAESGASTRVVGNPKDAAGTVRQQAALALLARGKEPVATTAAPPESVPGGAGPEGGYQIKIERAPRMQGIARTARIGTDGAMLAMVLQPEADEEAAGAATRSAYVETVVPAAFVALRIEGDPLLAPEGAELPASLEMRRVRLEPDPTSKDGTMRRIGEVTQAEGRLRIGAHYQAGPGTVGVRAVLSAIGARNEIGSGKAPEPAAAIEIAVALTRQGDAKAGQFRMEPRALPSTSGAPAVAWRADWGGPPLRATLMPEQGKAKAEVPPVEMTETAPLAPEAPDRLRALDALRLIGEVTEDEGFAARARRLLFADAALPAGALMVRATRDIVLFRRRRQVLCAPPAILPPPVALEGFTVLHVRAGDAEVARKLQGQLGRRGGFKGLDVRQVQVLHYADEKQMPEESVAEILAAWQGIDHGKRFAFGRVWEAAPATGQGWQNHARLARLMDTLSPLIGPAPSGPGTVGALATPPPDLKDAGGDGAMLLVTVGEEAEAMGHLVVRLDERDEEALRAALETGVPDVLLKVLQNGASAVVRFPGDGPDPGDIAAAQKALAPIGADDYVAFCLVSSAAAAEAAKALDQHVRICKALPYDYPADAAVTASVPEFGESIHFCSVVFGPADPR